MRVGRKVVALFGSWKKIGGQLPEITEIRQNVVRIHGLHPSISRCITRIKVMFQPFVEGGTPPVM